MIDTYNPSLRTSGPKMNIGEVVPLNFQSSLWDAQWDMHGTTNNGESYKIYSGDKNVTVGIIDSGLDIEHPDLKIILWKALKIWFQKRISRERA